MDHSTTQVITREAWLAVGAALMRQNRLQTIKNDQMDDFCLSLLFGNYKLPKRSIYFIFFILYKN